MPLTFATVTFTAITFSLLATHYKTLLDMEGYDFNRLFFCVGFWPWSCTGVNFNSSTYHTGYGRRRGMTLILLITVPGFRDGFSHPLERRRNLPRRFGLLHRKPDHPFNDRPVS